MEPRQARRIKVEAAIPSSVLFAAVLLICNAVRLTFWKLFRTGRSEHSHLARDVNMASKLFPIVLLENDWVRLFACHCVQLKFTEKL